MFEDCWWIVNVCPLLLFTSFTHRFPPLQFCSVRVHVQSARCVGVTRQKDGAVVACRAPWVSMCLMVRATDWHFVLNAEKTYIRPGPPAAEESDSGDRPSRRPRLMDQVVVFPSLSLLYLYLFSIFISVFHAILLSHS